jgi:hypothetical protein
MTETMFMLECIPNNTQKFPTHKFASKEFADDVFTRFGGHNSNLTEKLITNLIGSDCWAFGVSETLHNDDDSDNHKDSDNHNDIIMYYDCYTTTSTLTDDDDDNDNRHLILSNIKYLIEKYSYIHIWMFHPRHERGYKLVINTSQDTWERLTDSIQIYERII